MSVDTTTNKNDFEILEKLGNMFLVKQNGQINQIPATYKNKLLYEKELYKLINPENRKERVILSDDKTDDFIAISPTNSDSVYQLWVDEFAYPVMNKPSQAEDVLRAVYEAINAPKTYEPFRRIYNKIKSETGRTHVLKKAAKLFPKTDVIPVEDGWQIHGIFHLTWQNQIFLDTDREETSYVVRGGGVKETNKKQQFLDFEIDKDTISAYKDTKLQFSYKPIQNEETEIINTTTKTCPYCNEESECKLTAYKYNLDSIEHKDPWFNCNNCDKTWRVYKLTENEIIFLAKAEWLHNHRTKLDDDVFWNVIEKYVWNLDSVTQ